MATEKGTPTRILPQADYPLLPPRYPQSEHVCEMRNWRIECLQITPRNRWVCELLCQGGYRHDIYVSGSFRRCLAHARRFERAMLAEGLMPEAPIPVLNCDTRVMTWPDGHAAIVPVAHVHGDYAPRTHIRLV